MLIVNHGRALVTRYSRRRHVILVFLWVKCGAYSLEQTGIIQ